MQNVIDMFKKKPLTVLSCLIIFFQIVRYFYFVATTYGFDYIFHVGSPTFYFDMASIVIGVTLIYAYLNEKLFLVVICLVAEVGHLKFSGGGTAFGAFFQLFVIPNSVILLSGMCEMFYRLRKLREKQLDIIFFVTCSALAIPLFFCAALCFNLNGLLHADRIAFMVDFPLSTLLFLSFYKIIMSRWLFGVAANQNLVKTIIQRIDNATILVWTACFLLLTKTLLIFSSYFVFSLLDDSGNYLPLSRNWWQYILFTSQIYINPFVYVGLVYGIYKRNRIYAAAYYLLEIYIILKGGASYSGVWILFPIGSILGVIGVLYYHKWHHAEIMANSNRKKDALVLTLIAVVLALSVPFNQLIQKREAVKAHFQKSSINFEQGLQIATPRKT